MELSTGFTGNDVMGKALFALLVCALAALLSRLLQMPLKRLLAADKQHRTSGTIFQNLIRVLVWGTAACIILDICFGFDAAGLLGALGVVGIAVSLGAQETIANIIGGLIVSLSEMVGEGDWITIDGHKEARVVDTNWRRTILENEDSVQYAVPNSLMVSSLIEKGNPYFIIVVPFSLKVDVPDVEGLLAECEQAILDRQIETGHDFEAMRPKAHVAGASLGAIQAEVKIYANRSADSRTVERAVLPALVNLLQERHALADLPM